MSNAEEVSIRRVSLKEARMITSLNRRVFKRHAEVYVDVDEAMIAPISILQVARSAHEAGQRSRLLRTVTYNEIAAGVISHVKENDPESLEAVIGQVDEFFVSLSSPHAIS
jgi:hypothetical protein